MSRAETLTRHLKRHDSELYCTQEDHLNLPTKVLYVQRHNHSRPHEPYFIFALTDNWSAKGIPREWGIDVVLNRIHAIDLWKNETVVDRVLRDCEAAKESEARANRNSIESFLYEFRSEFAKSTNHINTAGLAKYDARRRGDLNHGRTK